ncbi:MAG: stage II sporulation protein P [Syntrophomonadaceae bacterium]|nr:stage II sporulation protein P [Syntrophomonadaceae bacterium]
MMKRALWLVALATVIMVCCGGLIPAAASHMETDGDHYYRLLDSDGALIHETSLQVNEGDIYIDRDNHRWEVVKVEGRIAWCRYDGDETLPAHRASTLGADISGVVPVESVAPVVAIYHTHSDESYIPSDGVESEYGEGGIYDVGAAFVQALEQHGFIVEYSEEAHDPHDINAYSRSRGTALDLLENRPDLIIDVHRDATSAGEYETTVEGEDATRIKIVVGSQNPNMKNNLEFAKQLKSAMDEIKPGLSNGIYVGKGDYNQDLSPHALLIEVGTHTNTKEEAEQGVEQFADMLAEVYGLKAAQASESETGEGNAPGAGTINDAGENTAADEGTPGAVRKPLDTEQESKNGYVAAVLILLAVAIAGGGWYWLNHGPKAK